MKFEGFTAWVEVEGRQLLEYNIELDDESRMVRCYIASKVDKEFCVCWSAEKQPAVPPRRTPAIRSRLKIDGYLCSKISGPALKDRIESVKVAGSDVRVCPKFGQIQLTDEETPESLLDEQSVKSMGSLELVLQSGYAVPRQHRQRSRTSTNCLPEAKPIYEKLKKAGNHQVVAGSIVHEHDLRSAAITLDHDPQADVTFVFLYRPRELLLAKEIIPSDEPAPTQCEGSRKPLQAQSPSFKDDDDDEADLMQQEALEAKLELITERRAKRRLDGLGERPVKRQKVEEIEARLFFRVGEVIDLTSA